MRVHHWILCLPLAGFLLGPALAQTEERLKSLRARQRQLDADRQASLQYRDERRLRLDQTTSRL